MVQVEVGFAGSRRNLPSTRNSGGMILSLLLRPALSTGGKPRLAIQSFTAATTGLIVVALPSIKNTCTGKIVQSTSIRPDDGGIGPTAWTSEYLLRGMARHF